MADSEADTRNWFLRISSGVVFGPVPTKALRLWAEQGRIQPGNEISVDKKNWVPAQSLDELDIAWYLEDSQGNLTGPFNKRAAEKLIADGRVGEGTSIIFKDDADLAHLVRPALENRRRTASASSDPELDFGEDNSMSNADENALRTECEGLRLRVEVLEKSQKQLLAAAEKECKSHERQLAAEHETIAKLQAELEEARLAETASANALHEAEGRINAAAKEVKAASSAKLTEANDKLAEAESRIAELKAELATVQKKLSDVQTDYTELLAFSNERDSEALSRIETLEEQSARREKTSAELERRCAELDKACKNLTSRVTDGKDQTSVIDPVASDRFVAMQIEYLTSLLNDGQKRQKNLQDRINDLVNIRSGELADAVERQAKQRTDRLEIRRSKDEIENLKLENTRLLEQSQNKEKELSNRIRMLEIDLNQTKSNAQEADVLRQQIRQLTDEINDRDQIIVRERKLHSENQQQLEQAQQALLERLETFEKNKNSAESSKEESSAKPTFHATPWMQFR